MALFPICNGDEWYPVGSSALVAHPPQGCVCCGFTNAFRHSSVAMIGYCISVKVALL